LRGAVLQGFQGLPGCLPGSPPLPPESLTESMARGQLPRTFRRRLGRLTPLQPVILIHVARGPQRLVVEADGPRQLLQLLAEQVNPLQLARRCGQLQIGSLNEILVAPVQQPPNLSVHQRSRPLCKRRRRKPTLISGPAPVRAHLSRTLPRRLRRNQHCPRPMLAPQ